MRVQSVPWAGRTLWPPVAAFLLILAGGSLIALLPIEAALALVVGGIVFLAVLVRVELGLYLLTFVVPFSSLWEINLRDFDITATDFLVPLIFVAWLTRLVRLRQARVTFTPLIPTLLFFLAVFLGSTLVATSVAHSFKEIAKWLEMGAIFLVTVNTVRERHMPYIVGGLLGAGVVEALVGWYQVLTGTGPAGFQIAPGVLRAFGTFGQPNPFAGYLGTLLPLGYGLILGGVVVRGFRLKLLWLSLAILLVALLMSFSRAGWLAVATALAIMTMVKVPRSTIYLVLAALLGMLVALLGLFNLLPPQVASRLASVAELVSIFDVRYVVLTPENWAVVERMVNWQAAWDMFVANPWLGVGVGNFSAVFESYALPGWTNTTGHAHNYYLNLLAETGVLGLLAYLLFLTTAFVYVGRRIALMAKKGWRTEAPWTAAATLGIMGVLVATSVHNLFDNVYVHSMAVQVGLMLGLASVSLRQLARK
ncbi:MAG: O-antigen ligase family protein [Chloroflexi bacterium]|nr:O-antigen ligase family protein [Chloroflexota bacterium]